MNIKLKLRSYLMIGLLVAAIAPFMVSSQVLAADKCPAASGTPVCCGDGERAYQPSIDLGCKGKGNGIMDLLFALVRFLSYGVGLVIVGSMTYAGIQYIGSRGDPNATAMAVKRLQANVSALLIFVFAFAIINYLVPGALLK